MLVSNTSTLVLLAKVGCLERFVDIVNIIEIPEEVQREAIFEKDSYDAKLIEKLIADNKIRVVSADKKAIAEIMSRFRLERGEAAAFVIFNHKKHKVILTDDGELIKLCKLQQVPFICAMAIIIRLYEKKRLPKDVAIKKLEELHTIGHYSEKLYEYFKSEVK